MSTWYCVSTDPTKRQQELSVRDALTDLGLPAYVPCETVERRIGRHKRIITRPVFPGYAFVVADEDDIRAILNVEGVGDFIRFTRPDGVRVPLRLGRNALVPIILAEIFGDLDYTRKPASYRPERGDRVHVRSGKWKGYLGRILSVSKRKAIMELEGKWGKLTLDPEHLERAA